MQGISSLAEKLLASQKGLYSMQLVIYIYQCCNCVHKKYSQK